MIKIRLELTQTTFRRLVWLQLLLCFMTIAAAANELLNSKWQAFDVAFNRLTIEYFDRSTALSDFEGVTYGAITLAALASLIGLLWLQRWARTLFLVSWIVSFPLLLFTGPPVSYSSNLASSLDGIGLMGGGALLLMAYSSGLGADWFVRDTGRRKLET